MITDESFEDMPCQTGIAAMDIEHQQIERLARAVDAAFSEGETRVRLLARLDDLIETVRSHFVEEDRVFAATGRPCSPAHLRDHASILEMLETLRLHCLSGYRGSVRDEFAEVAHRLDSHMAFFDPKSG